MEEKIREDISVVWSPLGYRGEIMEKLSLFYFSLYSLKKAQQTNVSLRILLASTGFSHSFVQFQGTGETADYRAGTGDPQATCPRAQHQELPLDEVEQMWLHLLRASSTGRVFAGQDVQGFPFLPKWQ